MSSVRSNGRFSAVMGGRRPVYDMDRCPYCGSTNLEVEYVDVGEGREQATPKRCLDCLAQEIGMYTDRDVLKPHEHSTGWYEPDAWLQGRRLNERTEEIDPFGDPNA